MTIPLQARTSRRTASRRTERAARRPGPPGSATVFLALALAACGGGRGPIRIGWAGSATDSVGAPALRATQLAVEEINRDGGVRGRPLELVAMDDAGDPDSAVRVAASLVGTGVVAVIGHIYSGATLAAAPIYNAGRRAIVQISPSASSPAVTRAGPYTFRVCPSDVQYGAALAQWAYGALGLRRGAVLYVNNDYGRGFRQTFAAEFARLGGQVVEVDPFLESRPEVRPFAERIARDRQAEFLVVAANIAEGELALRQLRGRDVRLPLLGGDGFDGIEGSGSVAEGVYVTTGYLATLPTEANRRFVEAYRQRYPESGLPGQPAAASYDIVYLLRRVMASVGTSPRAIRDAVAGVGTASPPFEGAVGTIKFDENGDVPELGVRMGVVRGGTLQPAEAR